MTERECLLGDDLPQTAGASIALQPAGGQNNVWNWCGRRVQEAEDEVERSEARWFDGSWVPIRYQISLLCFWAFANAMGLRVTLNIAIVSMVNFTAQETANVTDTCPDIQEQNTTVVDTASGEFDWDANTQAMLLGAYYYGYPILQVPGGYLAERIGAKMLLGGSILVCGICTLLSPLAAYWDARALIALQALMGLLSGPMYPSHHALWSKWAPPLERGKLIGLAVAGASVGQLVTQSLTGLLSASTILGGWPSAFYLFGSLTCLWFCVWMFMVYDSPSVHPRITQKEKDYIESATGQMDQVKYTNPPWRSVLTSVPVWALIISTIGSGVPFYAILNCSSLFFEQLFQLPPEQNGLLNALKSTVPIPLYYLGGLWADYMIARGVSTGRTRKIVTFVALGVSSTFIIVLGFVECTLWAAVTCMVLFAALCELTTGGMYINQLDIAPLYAGTIFGFGSSLSNVAGFLMPMLLPLMTGGKMNIIWLQPSRRGWRNFFFMSGGVGILSTIIFIVFASGEEQEWAKEKRIMIDDSANSDEENGSDGDRN